MTKQPKAGKGVEHINTEYYVVQIAAESQGQRVKSEVQLVHNRLYNFVEGTQYRRYQAIRCTAVLLSAVA